MLKVENLSFSYGEVQVLRGVDIEIPTEQIVCVMGRNGVGKTTLMQSAALIQRSRLFVGTDSGLMHLAFGVGTPVVALFGSGVEPKWGLRTSSTRILNRHLPCSPCTRFGLTPPCPIQVQCLREISAEDVFQEAEELLNGAK